MISEDAKKVRDVLIARGLETPLVDNGLSRDQKFERIQASFSDIARTLGLDLTDDSLRDTPERISRMYVDEIFSGLDYARFPKATSIANKMQVEEMVRIEGISVVSTCEHHFVTIDGVASVGLHSGWKNYWVVQGQSYCQVLVPSDRRVQERLTQQVLVALQTLLETDDVAVAIDAVHYCVKARGVMDANSRTLHHGAGWSVQSRCAHPG